MSLLFFSCCISFITLFVLLYRKNMNKKMNIPTWFLGSKRISFFKKNRIFSKPPLLSFFLVILATLLAAYIFNPKYNELTKQEKDKFVLIWLDPSLSAKLSRLENHFSAQEEAHKLYIMSNKIYGLSHNFLIQNGKYSVEYHLQILQSEEQIEKFILKELQEPPSPFYQSLNFKQVSNLVQNESSLQ
ncbi:MAG: hypothetical protein V4591_07055, partial [Bdellovibrionota bacterium]